MVRAGKFDTYEKDVQNHFAIKGQWICLNTL